MTSGPSGAVQRMLSLLAILFIAALPFRATVDKRGALLALMVIVLAAVSIHKRAWPDVVPASRALVAIALAWLGACFAWALATADSFEALRSVRSDVLAPILAFCVFHATTRSPADLYRWALTGSAAQVVLSVLVCLDPYQPDPAHRPAYIDVGVVSAWLVLSAAWLPVLWMSPQRDPRWGRVWAGVVTVSFVAASLATYNRLVWFCYALMAAAGAWYWWHARRLRDIPREKWHAWFAAGLVAALLAAGWTAIGLRAPSYSATAQESPAYVMLDPRIELWQAGAQMVKEKPLAGHGFGTDVWRQRFAERLPGHRFNHAHNAALNYAIQMGIGGALLVLGLFAAVWRAHLKHMAVHASWAGCCGVALTAGFFARNLTDDFFLRQPLLLFAAMAGMFLGSMTASRSAEPA
ncbi:MAG: O-antigen ligase family protein [Betaproteobacteria bacterium]|nr:O-antigen ligase family protein [Betaproteobacteria bacterium]